MREHYSSGAKWESIVGYSRAVKIGNYICVSGTTAIDDKGKVIGKDNPYLQTKRCLEIVKGVLEFYNATFNDVIRTRLYVTDISKWREYGRAHGEVFKEIKPATTMVEVSKLIDPAMMIELEIDAILHGEEKN